MDPKDTIMVVDDTHASLKLLVDYLSEEGYNVHPADSGKLALASVAQSPPELILLDIRMPGMDGFEVLRQLKARPESRNIPVIFLSAVTEIDQRIEGLKMGAVDFISKPFQRDELLTRIHAHLELSRLRMQSEKHVTELQRINEQLTVEIAERKRVEEELKISLAEKETLLKEIHHRVKNNLQIIASLLNLQSQYIKDEKTLAVIRESQNRIKAMALIHEKIYQSKSLDRIDYGDYLEKITRSLFESYGISPKKIVMKINAKNIFLHIDKAIPCSLIINELLSNSFKHAFPNDHTGEVRIDVKLDGDTVRLLYSDNGIGLPESITLDRTESLGMRLISGLIQQLKGTVEIQRKEGTTFLIAFNV